MNLLLDTHTLVWLMVEPEKLSAKVRSLIADPASSLIVSVASLWEIAIKASLPNSSMPVSDVNPVIENMDAFRIQLLPIKPGHLPALQRLPFHHRDPFDRILIAQAQVERLPLLSADKTFASVKSTLAGKTACVLCR